MRADRGRAEDLGARNEATRSELHRLDAAAFAKFVDVREMHGRITDGQLARNAGRTRRRQAEDDVRLRADELAGRRQALMELEQDIKNSKKKVAKLRKRQEEMRRQRFSFDCQSKYKKIL